MEIYHQISSPVRGIVFIFCVFHAGLPCIYKYFGHPQYVRGTPQDAYV